MCLLYVKSSCDAGAPRDFLLLDVLKAGMHLSCQTVVNHLIVERAFLHLDGRGPEFNFYCCHEYICYLIFHLKTNPGETIA